MLNNPPYYHGIIKKAIVAFGRMFSEIQIERMDDTGAVIQTVNVPIAYGPKEKWLVRLEQDPSLDNNVNTILPRMAFEITGYSYDASRKVNKMTKVASYDQTTLKTQFSPVPYNLDIELSLLTKTTEDALAVVEQILPVFTPDYTLSINAIPDLNVVNDVPIILNGVSFQDSYDGDFQSRREIIYTFNFTMKVNIFGSITSSGVIKKANITLPNQPLDYFVKSNVPETFIIDTWTNDTPTGF
jgi:hypothetical protein